MNMDMDIEIDNIEKLYKNNDYNNLLSENQLLYIELKKYEIPKIIYSNYKELDNIKVSCFNELKNFLIDLLKTKDFLIFYDKFICPDSLNIKLEEILKILLKSKDNNNLNWIKNKTNEIVTNINIFLQSMTVHQSQIITNENYLIDIIFENIKLQIKKFLNLIPLIKCNSCNGYYNIIDNQNICKFCLSSNIKNL